MGNRRCFIVLPQQAETVRVEDKSDREAGQCDGMNIFARVLFVMTGGSR